MGALFWSHDGVVLIVWSHPVLWQFLQALHLLLLNLVFLFIVMLFFLSDAQLHVLADQSEGTSLVRSFLPGTFHLFISP